MYLNGVWTGMTKNIILYPQKTILKAHLPDIFASFEAEAGMTWRSCCAVPTEIVFRRSGLSGTSDSGLSGSGGIKTVWSAYLNRKKQCQKLHEKKRIYET